MTLKEKIEKLRGLIAEKLKARNAASDELSALRESDNPDEARVLELRETKRTLDSELDEQERELADLVDELQRDEAAQRLSQQVMPGAPGTGRAYDQVARVGQEERTYRQDHDPKGKGFIIDVGRAWLGDPMAQARLARHVQEEQVERGVDYAERAVGTGAFAGLTVPQYLTDLVAPNAKANRPFADAMNHHDLPESGMTVNLSLVTTGSSAALQASENTAVSETNMDDTLLSIPVQTNAGQQTVSRQGIERGTGVDDTVVDDLFRSYATTLDSTLINQAATGLSAVAGTTAAYTDATPTVAELYPKFLQALSLVEGALLDQDPGDNIAIMHSRRWYWIQNAVGTSWPFAQQPGILPQMGIANLAERYGGGVRGVLPNGTPVIVDNNVPTNKGGGTEDEIYIASQRECHLWEDPSAPMMIRAEQPALASLGVLFVVYGYFAYTHARYAQAQKISGTGLIAPTFTGV